VPLVSRGRVRPGSPGVFNCFCAVNANFLFWRARGDRDETDYNYVTELSFLGLCALRLSAPLLTPFRTRDPLRRPRPRRLPRHLCQTLST
jgi:hypothetical protein